MRKHHFDNRQTGEMMVILSVFIFLIRESRENKYRYVVKISGFTVNEFYKKRNSSLSFLS